MANRTATLYIRLTKKGRSGFYKPVYQSKGRLKPQYAMVEGEPQHHKDGVYYVRFGADGGKQQFVLVGKDPYVALDKLEEKKRWLRDRERQVTPQKPVDYKPESSRISVDDAVEQYFKNLHSQGKDPKTIRAYKVAVEEFRQSCPKKFMDEIKKQDLIDFMGWLRRCHPMQIRP
jgi:Phage integrase, N-terminal SAM-like domain